MRTHPFRDLHVAWRSLRRHRGSSLLIVLMLGLGIGGNVVAFSWIDAILLRPLPFAEPGRLVALEAAVPRWQLEAGPLHYGDFDAWRRQQSTFEAMAVLRGKDFNLSGLDRPLHARGALVSHDFLRVLALRPILGRAFDEAEDRPGGAKVVMLGHGLWQSRFGGGEDVLRQQVYLDGEPHTVIGVLPPTAGFPLAADLWVPLGADAERWQGYSLTGLGRLKPGVDATTAAADLLTAQEGRRAAGKVRHEVVPVVRSLHERYLGQAEPYVLALMVVVAFVLAIACANVTCLLLIHAVARRREFGIRSALGAGRRALLRQLLAESLLLAALGGALGWWLAVLGLEILMAALGDGLPFWATPELDLRVLLFCAVLCLVTAMLAGLAPYSRVAGKSVIELLGTAALDRRGHRLPRILVGMELALASILLFGTGVTLHSFFELRTVDPGFRGDNRLTFALHLPTAYGPLATSLFYDELRQELAALPGALSASAASVLPLSGSSGVVLAAEGSVLGDVEPGNAGSQPVVLHRSVAPEYFRTMGIPVVRGRAFGTEDGTATGAPVVIVNESFARRHWPDQEVIGRRVKYSAAPRGEPPWMTVVGVARDVLHDGIDQPPRPGIYVPMAQEPRARMTLVVHSEIDPRRLVEPIRDLVWEKDPRLGVFQILTLQSRIDDSLLALRWVGTMASVFMAIALVLALGGIYGSVSYAVSQRRRELAVRMAIGARRGQVQRLVLGSGARLIAAGIGSGIVLSTALTRGLEALLYRVETNGTWILGLSASSLAAAAIAAAFVPAWKASRDEPAKTLQEG